MNPTPSYNILPCIKSSIIWPEITRPFSFFSSFFFLFYRPVRVNCTAVWLCFLASLGIPSRRLRCELRLSGGSRHSPTWLSPD